MKFGKNLIRVVELSDPEWGPYWINYKYLKKKINDIVETRNGVKVAADINNNPTIISQSTQEVEFFRSIKKELKKISDFFASAEQLYNIRHGRIVDGFMRLREDGKKYDKNTWSRLLRACVKFYKDVLLLENYAIMNYCGFSKILKKHDKLTGFSTREAFMRNVMSQQNFTHYHFVLHLLRESEQLFKDIQGMESLMPLEEEERLFIDAMRDLNYQASCLQEQENQPSATLSDNSDSDSPTRSRSASVGESLTKEKANDNADAHVHGDGNEYNVKTPRCAEHGKKIKTESPGGYKDPSTKPNSADALVAVMREVRQEYKEFESPHSVQTDPTAVTILPAMKGIGSRSPTENVLKSPASSESGGSLDTAAMAALIAANKVAHTDDAAYSLPKALSWMQAVSRGQQQLQQEDDKPKEGPTDGQKEGQKDGQENATQQSKTISMCENMMNGVKRSAINAAEDEAEDKRQKAV